MYKQSMVEHVYNPITKKVEPRRSGVQAQLQLYEWDPAPLPKIEIKLCIHAMSILLQQ